MGFLTPLMLFGALAAAIPVAIHLFFRSRYRTVPWAAMKFLLTSVEQTSRRLKFQELLLLLLRMAVLVMLALAFARPISSVLRGAGRGDSVDAVFVIDTSFSMGAQDGAKTRIKRAQEQAITIIDELPPHSTVQIITCAGKHKTMIGPRSPANLDQAKHLINNLELTHMATDLCEGVAEAQGVLAKGQASNKELYVFSDMQQTGFEQQAGRLRSTLVDVKEKAVVHFVRCGTRTVKNAAIVSIAPQTGVPRPHERIGFAVTVRNTSDEEIENIDVTLAVDGDVQQNGGTERIKKLPKKETVAVTLWGKPEKAGLRVLTAKINHDELDGDNRYDQVILVRDQVNILIVDGNYSERFPDQASSYFLAHSLLPVVETARATYKYNPRVVASRLATAALLQNQDICILVNCALQGKAGADALEANFVEALDPFVREGHGLLIFSGDNVEPEPYNKILGKKLGLLPLPLMPALKIPSTWEQIAARWKEFKVKAKEKWSKLTDEDIDTIAGNPKSMTQRLQDRYGYAKEKADQETQEFGNSLKVPFLVNRSSFAAAPPSYRNFKDDGHYEVFDAVPVWRHLDLDESGFFAKAVKKDEDPTKEKSKDSSAPKDDSPAQVIVRLNSNKPLVVAKKIDAGEVVFVATAAQREGTDPETGVPHWTIFHELPVFVPFLDTTIGYLVHAQTQTYNRVAGETLSYFPRDKKDHAYYLLHPDRVRMDRLGLPEKKQGYVVSANDLPRAGVYYMTSALRGAESSEAIQPEVAVKTGVPIAVIPDLEESKNLTTLTNAQIDTQLGFTPIHIVAGDSASVPTAADRLNREWTVWALLAVLALVLFEVVLAWWCGRAW
jgi:uncharacterized protein YjbJ (UPF0337 family)